MMSVSKEVAARPVVPAGEFSIRLPGGDEPSDTELRESMTEFGWLQHLPGIRDEHGLLITGRRRSQIAGEIGIPEPWPIVTVHFGDGDEADAARLRLAIASNIGGRPFTRQDRIAIAQHLYGEKRWTLKRIGEALGKSTTTVGRDLEGFTPDGDTERPKGGRPKGAVTRQIDDGQLERIIQEGLTWKQIMAEFGVGQSAAQNAKTRATIIAEYREEFTAQAKTSPAFPAHGAPPPPRCPQCYQLTSGGLHRDTGLAGCSPVPPSPASRSSREAPPVREQPAGEKNSPRPAGREPQFSSRPAEEKKGRPAVQPPLDIPPAPGRARERTVSGWTWDAELRRWTVQRNHVLITVALDEGSPPGFPADLFRVTVLG